MTDLADGAGSYNNDVREVERTWRYLPEYTRTPAAFNEGYLPVAVPPFPIPSRALTPNREDCDDMLVPVCLSAHVGALQDSLRGAGQVLAL